MCPRKYLSGTLGFMKEALFRKIVDEIKRHPVEAVVPFFRGESLMHPDFVGMMRLLREKTRAEIQLATNALLLDEDISKALLRLDIHFISFSVDALSKETYDKIRSGGDFARTMKNIETFLNMRDHFGSSSTRVQISATETVHNKAELPAFVEYWKPRVDRVRIYPQHSDGGRFGRLNDASLRRKPSSRQPCMKPFTDMVICYDGTTALCNHDWYRQKEDALGSVTDQAIDKIWQNARYRAVRQKHIKHRWDALQPCDECDHWMEMDQEESPVGMVIA